MTSADLGARLAALRAMEQSPNEFEADAARALFAKTCAKHSLTEEQAEALVYTERPGDKALPTDVVDFGAYIEGTQSRRLLYAVVAYVLPWERWMKTRITRRFRKYSFHGLSAAEAAWAREILLIHSKGLQAEQKRYGLDKESLKERGLSSRRADIKMRLNGLTLAYLNRQKLFSQDAPPYTGPTGPESEERRTARSFLAAGMTGVGTPIRHSHRMGEGALPLPGTNTRTLPERQQLGG